MNIQIIIDKQSELRMNEAADKLREHLRNNKIKAYDKDIIVIFSNDCNFVKDTRAKLPKTSIVVNVTENLSEQHVINVVSCVADICYLKTDVNMIATRIINAYNKTKLKSRRGI